jgi:L-lactate dehydrogenase complex protein LldG
MSSSRSDILGKIAHGLATADSSSPVRAPKFSSAPALIEPTPGDVALFADRLRAVDGEAVILGQRSMLRDALQSILPGAGVLASPSAAREYPEIDELSIPLIPSDDAKRALAACSCAVTLCDWGIADTGTLFFSRVGPTRIETRRALGLPPMHVVIVRPVQIVSTLSDVIAALGVAAASSPLVAVTGPSRTADIEKTLVTGVHGPRRLVAIVVP